MNDMSSADTAILETVSKKTEQRKRGRPRLIPALTDEVYRGLGLYLDMYTPRAHQNVYYRQRAIEALGPSKPGGERFRWLYDAPAVSLGQAKAWRPLILSELGRLPDPEDIKAIAALICERKPKAKDAVTMIRRYRLGTPKRGNPLTLWKELEDTVNRYLVRYPETSWEQVCEAVTALLDEVSSQAGNEHEEERAA